MEDMHPSSFTQKIANEIGCYISQCSKVTEAETVERCAQWLEDNTKGRLKTLADDMRRALKEKPAGPAGDRGQVGWMGGEGP